MQFLNFLQTPFPRPEQSQRNLLWVSLVGLGCSGFIMLYNPFGIRNDTEHWYIDLVILGMGLLFIATVIAMEWGVPRLIPQAFRRWTLWKAILWYTGLILLLGANNFIYKNIWGGFQEFTWMELGRVLLRTLSIGATVAFAVLGIGNYLRNSKWSWLGRNEEVVLAVPTGKSMKVKLHDILYISSDDNYVDIHYAPKGHRRRRVLRSSLKNIENQIVHPLSPIYRCHRQYLINTEHFKIRKMSSRSLTLGLDKYPDEIPVSKQYVELIKKHLSTHPS